MNITTTQLKEMILEETLALLDEKATKPKQAGPGAPFHSKETGEFTDAKHAGSYSHSGNQLSWPSKSNAAECGRGSRYRCSDRSLKYEDNADDTLTASDTSIHMDADTDRQRARSGYKDASLRVFQDIEDGLVEQEQQSITFSASELKKYRSNLWREFLKGIESYERSSNPKD